jgi:quercetin dioxygenase-like cupin family protein
MPILERLATLSQFCYKVKQERMPADKRAVSNSLEHEMVSAQTFVDTDVPGWVTIDGLAGVTLLPLAQPVKDGSIHRARLWRGTVIPVHTHPADEYVMVLSGTIDTGGRRCEAGTFWITPAGTRQGPHVAITDVELLTVRLGAMGPFGE